MGPDGIIYPGTCRDTPRTGPRPNNVNLRLDMKRAVDGLAALSFTEHLFGTPGVQNVNATNLIHTVGDVVLSRRDMATSYHLSVVIDDAAQKITDVIRGEDLFEATQIHVLLQQLLKFPSPEYHHHKLIRDAGGKRLAKRDDARAIALYRQQGLDPTDVKSLVGLG